VIHMGSDTIKGLDAFAISQLRYWKINVICSVFVRQAFERKVS
jgi:hypothetical protein